MQIIEDLVNRARRRLILNETLGQIASAAAFACGGLALILFLGTRYFEWWTIAVPAGLALALGAFGIWRRFPNGYVIAQRLDRHAGLPDLLSTAVHFRNYPVRAGQFQNGQRAQAEFAAREFNLACAIPYRFPRALYPLAALSLLASGLVVLRYSLTRSLDLRAPLTDVLFEDQLAHQPARRQSPAASKSFKALKAAESLMARLNTAASPDQRQDPDALDKAIDQALAPPSPGNTGQGNKADNAGKNGQQKNSDGLDQGKKGDSLDGNQQSANSSPNQDGKSPDSQQHGAPSDKNGKGSEGNNSSLLSKLKDAVSNMFSRSRQNGGDSQKGAQQNGQMAKADRQNSDKNSGGKGQNQGQSQADAQEGDPNGDPQEGEQAQGKNGTKTSAQNSAQAGSGIGSQDGAKDLRAAAQLKAMGKISEIIGKRAATVTGETMVEVQSGNQQLRTAYTEKSASHADANSDLNRDEIPTALQTYVANYFEQVRKSSSRPANTNLAR
jgi:hypothetical protein